MNKPNLFLVGAMKFGTTTLHKLLAPHLQISMSEAKTYLRKLQFPQTEELGRLLGNFRNGKPCMEND